MARILTLSGYLVLPVSALLFLQWPLRDVIHGWSREANDLAQWMFALYAAAALTYATRQSAHPSIGRRPPRAAAALCLLPWACFILIEGAPAVWRSVAGLESFPDTYNPGYFIVKIAAWLLALAAAGQAARDLMAGK